MHLRCSVTQVRPPTQARTRCSSLQWSSAWAGTLALMAIFTQDAAGRGVAADVPPGADTAARGAPLSIPYLSQREYRSTLWVVRKLGDFDGYGSYEVEFDSDKLALRAVMNIPATAAPAHGYPVLIMNHGNAGNDWERFAAYYSEHQDSEEYRNLSMHTRLMARYAKDGFVVLFQDYRGHGRSETHGQHPGNWQLDRYGNKSVNKQGQTVPRVLDDEGLRFNGWLYTAYYTIDALKLVAAVSSQPSLPDAVKLDAGNLFMWGHSLGGDVTARAFTCSRRIKAVSLWSPATTSLWDQAHHYQYDSIYADGISMENLFTELQTYNRLHHTALRARDMAPNNFIEQVRGPVQVQVSIGDTGVRSAWGIEYVYELQEYGVQTSLHVYPGTDHSFKGEMLEQAIQADLAFFRARMQE